MKPLSHCWSPGSAWC